MKKSTLEKAILLKERIETLSIMKIEFRPEHCNGVGVCGITEKNSVSTRYKFDLWSTHNSNTDDDSLIMRAGIETMYVEICKLLGKAEEELENLN